MKSLTSILVTVLQDALFRPWHALPTLCCFAVVGLGPNIVRSSTAQVATVQAALPAGSLFDIETGSTVTHPSPYRILSLDGSGVLTGHSHRITHINYDLGGQDFQAYAASFLQTGLMEISTHLVANPPGSATVAQAEQSAPADNTLTLDLITGSAIP